MNSALFLGLTVFVSVIASSLHGKHPDDSFALVAILSAAAVLFAAISIVSLLWVIRQPVGWPVVFNRQTGSVVQMQGRVAVTAAWADLRPFVERVYNAQGAPFWKLRLLRVAADGKVEKNLILKILAPGPEGCAAYFEYLRRYMAGNWREIPDTMLVSGVRRSLLREFRHDFGWMFGTKRSWHERPTWRKVLMVVLLPLLVFVIWPLGFFILFGSCGGWVPKFPRDVYAQTQGGHMPVELAPRIRAEPTLNSAEQLSYSAIIVVATAVWVYLGSHYLGGLPFFDESLP